MASQPQKTLSTETSVDKPVTCPLARVIAISSGKGGVGKSSLSLNLAIELSRLGRRVCVFDADTNLANINIMTGLSPAFTLHDVLLGNQSLKDVLLCGPGGIKIIPAASGLMDFVRFDRQQQDCMLELIKQLESIFDFILIDTAAGINETVLAFLAAAPEAIITITTEPTSLTDAFSLIKVLKQQGIDRSLQLVVNKAPSFQVAKEVVQRFSRAVKKYLDIRFVAAAYVLEDRNVARSIMQQRPFSLLYPQSPASSCIRSFAGKLKQCDAHGRSSISDYLLELRQDEPEAGGIPVTNTPSTVLPSIDNPSTSMELATQELLTMIQSAPYEQVEPMMALIFSRWVQRQRERHDSEVYKAAIRFASKLRL